ncbi:BgTH12-03469 [Blumeria graminis f. sp. triticale]|uniref:BgTH12-03469 n=1 Tax=Blumeria graminis f. sp. triticale TaxID=1689686 RepID=A0A9W4DCJ6_BLUGR|nr:BgTH12-03469 [Blumeria graminis f. sp. triticale]
MSFTRCLVRCVSLFPSHCLHDSANTAIWTFAVFTDRNKNYKNQYLTFVPFVLHRTSLTYT